MYRYPDTVFVIIEIFVGGLVGELEILDDILRLVRNINDHYFVCPPILTRLVAC